ncbi:hypothetical protein [Sphingomonas sp. ID0503]|uniref:hypothetical protein n=1 Tax=Sphingomonas sp. ID0503 TaxID=3399691 RepID=UPI003AFAC2A7
MRVWCFIGRDDLWAITAEEHGAALPPEHGPWHPHRSIVLTATDPDEIAAERLIREHGFCCFHGATQG